MSVSQTILFTQQNFYFNPSAAYFIKEESGNFVYIKSFSGFNFFDNFKRLKWEYLIFDVVARLK